jgi:hypothetical protein
MTKFRLSVRTKLDPEGFLDVNRLPEKYENMPSVQHVMQQHIDKWVVQSRVDATIEFRITKVE